MNWRCPICRKPVDSDSSPDFPFCSERCRLIDLGKWSSGQYVISSPVNDIFDEIPEGRPGSDEKE
jgi:uncharacterized protein